MRRLPAIFLGALVILAACGRDDNAGPGRATTDADLAAADPAAERRGMASAIASGRADLSPEEIEAGRLDGSWRNFARPGDGAPGANPGRQSDGDPPEEAWEEISPTAVNGPPGLPLYGDVAGPSVAKIQIMLDRARFSPGIIDGRWGKNTEKAVYYFQRSNALLATGRVDSPTVDALRRVAGEEQVRTHRLAEQDVAGPFVDVPEDIYEFTDVGGPPS